MKLTLQRVLLSLAVATLGAGAMGTADAQLSPAAQNASPSAHNDHGDGHGERNAGRGGEWGNHGDHGYSRHDGGHFRHHHHGHFRNDRAGFRHFRGGPGGAFVGASGGAPFVGSLLRATGQLDLTADQRTSLQNILKSARPTRPHGAQPGTRPANEPQRPGMSVLGNPGDPGYAAAVQRAEAEASGRIQKQSELAGKIYAVLTPAQQKKLPTVLASMQSRGQGRGGRWQGRGRRDDEG